MASQKTFLAIFLTILQVFWLTSKLVFNFPLRKFGFLCTSPSFAQFWGSVELNYLLLSLIFPRKNRDFCQLPQVIHSCGFVSRLSCLVLSVLIPRINRDLWQLLPVLPSLGVLWELCSLLVSVIFPRKIGIFGDLPSFFPVLGAFLAKLSSCECYFPQEKQAFLSTFPSFFPIWWVFQLNCHLVGVFSLRKTGRTLRKEEEEEEEKEKKIRCTTLSQQLLCSLPLSELSCDGSFFLMKNRHTVQFSLVFKLEEQEVQENGRRKIIRR